MLFSCMMFDVFMWLCMSSLCIPNYYVMVRCNDIHLAKAFQYAGLSLVGPSSSSRIGSHIGRDMFTIDDYPISRDDRTWVS